ncbi:MAG: site-specific integrase [Oscillospiraceae bacterium]|nr:site-specific integrase [Oscillospiraceae bacterium]
MARKSAAGTGTIRKRTVTKNGKQYTWWEARYTNGYDPGTGKQIQRSITGKTQKEVAQKLKATTVAIDQGTYIAPSKMTVGQWLDIWTAEYLGAVKPSTLHSYKTTVRNHLKPNLGAIKLDALTPHMIQGLYNGFTDPQRAGGPLSAKTVKNIHGILHKALQQALMNSYIRFNPADPCVLPRVQKQDLQPMDETQITAFLKAIKGNLYEDLFIVTLFTGMRQGEIHGLMWDCVDLTHGKIRIDKQLQYIRKSKGQYRMVPTKNSKGRTITLPPTVLTTLHRVRLRQLEDRLRYGECWLDSGYVFTDELGRHLKPQNTYREFKRIVASIGCPNTRFHDLRHSYAVAAIKSGDDIKTVQENLGHATAAFTLDIYGHVTDQMKQASAARMEQFIKTVNA